VSDPGDYDNGEIGGMIGRGNGSTRRKPAPVLLCPPQTPHAARTRTRATAVGSQRLTAELRHGLTFVITLFARTHFNPFPGPDESSLHSPIMSLLRSVLMFSPHVCLGIPVVLSRSVEEAPF
jgi:hypothetical protein